MVLGICDSVQVLVHRLEVVSMIIYSPLVEWYLSPVRLST